MGFDDPFWGYSVLLRVIVYGLIPAFTVVQFFRLRRGLHVFQLEGYRRRRFLQWCMANRRRAMFVSRSPAKKPLAMTGRAWRILVTATILNVAVVLVAPGIAHLFAGGWPADVATWAVTTVAAFFGAPLLLTTADLMMAPVQKAINARYLAAARRKLHSVSPTVIGITGSFGKTSTKFAVQGLLGSDEEVLATPGSFNTPLGVCRTINERLTKRHRYFVVEMGAYGIGDIAELCRFVSPTIGVLTAIGPAHLERFGSIDAIRTAKYELIESLPPDGVAVMNVDDPEVRALADRTHQATVIRYGIDPSGRPDVAAEDIATTPHGTEMMIVDDLAEDKIHATSRLLGRHAVGHVLAGAAVARACGIDLATLEARIRALAPVEHRLQLIDGTGGVTVIDDAYNSNPAGAAAALDVLADMPAGRRIVVTPGMVELGPLQRDANEELGRQAAAVADVVIVVGSVNRDAIVSGARRGDAEVIVVASLSEAEHRLRSLLRAGDAVLFENDLPDQYEG